MYSYAYFWFYLVVFCSSEIQADFTNVDELVEASAKLIAGTYVPPTNNDAYFENMSSTETLEYGSYDFVIAGGGTAGLIVANRLIKANFTVLIIDAGDSDPDVTAILGWFIYYASSNEYSWTYSTIPQQNACLSLNGSCAYTRGKVLGGSSSTNAGMYVRGNPRDYDIWAELGNSGWSYDEVLPYFKKAESARFHDTIDYEYHGFDGLQGVDVPEDIPDLTAVILNALNETGLESIDYNGRQQLGYSRTQNFLTKNIRSSSNFSYLSSEVTNNSNLIITLQSLVTKVIIVNQSAVAVEFVKNGQYYIAKASKEVILSSGTIGTPQILMLSGIGPASELKALSIEVVADLPVGKNFHDHMGLSFLSYGSDNVYFNYTLRELVQLWTHNVGPLITASQTMTFLDLTNDSYPDVEVSTIYGSTFENNSIYCNKFIPTVSLLHPQSIGELTLASADPRDYPLINPNFLSIEQDIETIYQGIQFVLSLNNTKALTEFQLTVTSTPACDEFDEQTREWWYCFIKQRAIPGFHPVGTAKMGPDPETAVVNAELKVHGIENLRVVDASVMPIVNSGHTNAPTVMIAEKSAEIIILEHS